MPESNPLSALKQRLAGAEMAARPSCFSLGAAPLDLALGGGLARARLHELWPAHTADYGAATGFALTLAHRAAPDGSLFWIGEEQSERRHGSLYGPGLAELGIDPGRMLFVNAVDEAGMLRAASDVVRSPAGRVAVIASHGSLLDLTATRRLTLFAERSGTTAILLRAAEPHGPSAAATRWRVAASRSAALEADAPGRPTFRVDLLRQRSGPPSSDWALEWDRDRACLAPLSRDLAADAGGGLLAAG